jgi:hypothetical protein
MGALRLRIFGARYRRVASLQKGVVSSSTRGPTPAAQQHERLCWGPRLCNRRDYLQAHSSRHQPHLLVWVGTRFLQWGMPL